MTNKNILVAFFSASGITKKVAKNLSEAIDSDLYEIKPEIPYTNADLNWMDTSSRSSLEMKDLSSRPEIVDDNFTVDNYDTIFLGFPIWWYIAPTIVNSFLEKYDFSGKKIILFATSGGSGFGGTIEKLRQSVNNSAEIIEGEILNHNPDKETLKNWAEKYIKI